VNSTVPAWTGPATGQFAAFRQRLRRPFRPCMPKTHIPTARTITEAAACRYSAPDHRHCAVAHCRSSLSADIYSPCSPSQRDHHLPLSALSRAVALLRGRRRRRPVSGNRRCLHVRHLRTSTSMTSPRASAVPMRSPTPRHAPKNHCFLLQC
jgi:hypothetical protein